MAATRVGRSLLEIEDLSIRFGGVLALDGVEMSVASGEICGLIGPNGAGKTTLFNCITRVYEPDTGTIRFGEDDVLGMAPHEIVRHGIARTFQNLALFPSLSVLDNTIVGMHSRQPASALASLTGWPTARRTHRRLRAEAMDILAWLELGPVAHQPAAGLPFGTLKRVELARALAAQPRLLLLDEPAGGLTHEEVDELGATLQRIRDDFALSMLLVEHHMGLVMGVSDHVVAMEFGRTIAAGTPEEVRENPAVIAAYLGDGA